MSFIGVSVLVRVDYVAESSCHSITISDPTRIDYSSWIFLQRLSV
jgi:hypothetical protein